MPSRFHIWQEARFLEAFMIDPIKYAVQSVEEGFVVSRKTVQVSYPIVRQILRLPTARSNSGLPTAPNWTLTFLFEDYRISQ